MIPLQHVLTRPKRRYQLIDHDPTHGLEFLPVEKRLKYISSKEDVAKVLLAAPPEIQDYLVAIKETMARMGEINRLTWEEVNFEGRYVVLYTRKKKGSHLTPRKVPMTSTLYHMLARCYKKPGSDQTLGFLATLLEP